MLQQRMGDETQVVLQIHYKSSEGGRRMADGGWRTPARCSVSRSQFPPSAIRHPPSAIRHPPSAIR